MRSFYASSFFQNEIKIKKCLALLSLIVNFLYVKFVNTQTNSSLSLSLRLSLTLSLASSFLPLISSSICLSLQSQQLYSRLNSPDGKLDGKSVFFCCFSARNTKDPFGRCLESPPESPESPQSPPERSTSFVYFYSYLSRLWLRPVSVWTERGSLEVWKSGSRGQRISLTQLSEGNCLLFNDAESR